LSGVDFRYAPPWWQTAICLPDDSDKMLVGKEGQLLLDFGGGGPRNFGICLAPEAVGGSVWLRQQTLNARVPIVQTWKDANGVELFEETFVTPPKPGKEYRDLPERQAVMLLTFKNGTSLPATCRSGLRIQSPHAIRFAQAENSVSIGESTSVSASEPIEACASSGTNNSLLTLPTLALKPRSSYQIAFTVDRHAHRTASALNVKQAAQLRDTARDWWEKADLPFETIQVPDPGIQAMLESCVRNIWQAREIRGGQPAFHVGPTVYRGLWMVDGSFLLETAALLGRGEDARAGIEYLLSHQKPDGSFEIIGRFWKENGIALWAATRHAFLTQDKAWLRAHWPALRRVVKAIQMLRATVPKDPSALNFELLPPGFVDGGIGSNDKPEYSNTCWCLAGLKAAIEAARWLEDQDSAAAWQKEYDSLYAAYRRAAARDTLQDQFGNAYVPAMMGNLDKHVPARGQWAFCHAVYPGQVFSKEDPLVEGQLAMLRATKMEGMVYDTGWMRAGIWTYFASFYGHAELWQGRGREAARVLYDFARHAAPVRVWREEQKPLGKGNEEVGDMPHNWASAEFIRLTTHLIELDRGNDLHLLEGFPQEWARPGMVTKLNGVLTPFGPLRLELRAAADGRTVRLKMSELNGSKPARIVLHLQGLTGKDETESLPAQGDVDVIVATHE
jgi:GH15 family glucan-1,4-alpha-glucosidase